MESETFQETMQWLRKKHKKDRAQVRERQNELKELTFRISKRLDGTFSSPVAKKYRPLSMDVGISISQNFEFREILQFLRQFSGFCQNFLIFSRKYEEKCKAANFIVFSRKQFRFCSLHTSTYHEEEIRR